nr:microtubule associated tumor suppressor 1 [Hymenolepis microstoma]
MTSALRTPSKIPSMSSIPDSLAKSQSLPKRISVLSTGTNSGPFTGMTLRSAALKNKNGVDMNSSNQLNGKKASTTRSLQKPAIIRTKRTVADSTVASESQTQKSPTANSTTKAYGTATSTAANTRAIPPSPSSQSQKSLKDHLAEIRANATPRRVSEVASPVATRLRKNSRPAITTSVTSATVPLRRTNSLIPKTSGRSKSSAATSINPAASKSLIAEKEAELTALRQRYEANAAQWSKAFDAFCIFSQWSINRKDDQIKWASKRQKEAEDSVNALSKENTQIKADMEQLLQQHAKSQAEQSEAWENERSSLRVEMEAQRINLQTEKKKEIEKIQSQREADISELQKAYDAQLAEERKIWAARVAESHNKISTQLDQQQIDHETQMAELKRQNAIRVSELESRLKLTESELLAKLERLNSECNELRKAAAEARERISPEFQTVQFPSSTQPAMCDFSVQMPASAEEEAEFLQAIQTQNQENEELPKQPSSAFNFDDIPISMTRSCYMPQTKPQVRASFYSPAPTRLNKQSPSNGTTPCTDGSTMPEEIESLKTVLELKSSENADLRQKVMKLEEQLMSAKDLTREIKELQNKNENLGALLELRAESQKQLQDRYQGVFHNLDKEIKEKKKLKMECESLRFKLLDAHHRIEQINAANASEDENTSMTESLYMNRSVYSDARVTSSNSALGRGSRPVSETLESSITEAEDHFPAGSFIALDNRPATSSRRVRRGLMHDRTKRRTLATSAELQH